MRTFSVKNFERFQHYKDRAPPWIKLYNELLEDYGFGCLPDALKGQLMSLWLLASRTENKMPFDAKWVAKKINATTPVDLDALVDAGFIIPYSEEAARGKREEWPSRYIPEAVRIAVLERDGNKCRECEATDPLEIDHIIPVSKGGTGTEDNLQILCRSCNRKKRAKIGYADAEQVATQEISLRSLEREKRESREETEQIAASRAPKEPRRKSKTPLPDGFPMSAENETYAQELGFNQFERRREHQKFCNHAKQNDRRCVNWNAAEHNWLTNAAEFAGKKSTTEAEIVEDNLIEVLDQPALDAWDAYGRRTNGKPYPRNKRGGWRFPSKFPPGHEEEQLRGVQAIIASQGASHDG